jgi:hypothetical protein
MIGQSFPSHTGGMDSEKRLQKNVLQYREILFVVVFIIVFLSVRYHISSERYASSSRLPTE